MKITTTTEIDDADIVDLAKKIATVSRPIVSPQSTSATTPFLMSREAYADRVSFSLRKLDALLSAAAFVGRGRLRRVHVERADAALLAALEDGPVDDVVMLAVASARKSK